MPEPITPTELRSARLLLRPWRADDAPAVLAACQDAEIPRWIGAIPTPYTDTDARHFVTLVVPAGWVDGSAAQFAVVVDDLPVAAVGLHRRPDEVGEIGYWAAAEARGRGVVTEAAGLVARWAVATLEHERLEILHLLGNTPSCRVADKLGFATEGVLRGRIEHRGERRDAELHALTAADLLDRLAAQLSVLGDGDLLLRGWRSSDVPAVVAACRDPEIARWTMAPAPYGPDEGAAFVARQARRAPAGTGAGFAAVGPDDELLGSFHLRRTGPDVGEVGYWVSAPARGRGVGTAGLRLLTRYAVEELGLARVELRTLVGNAASQRLAAACGYRREAVQRAARTMQGGRRDLVLHALLADDG